MPNKRNDIDPAKSIQLSLGRDVRLPMDSVIQCPEFSVGDFSRINGPINVRGSEPCTIGNYCALGYVIHILTTDHKTCFPNLQIAFQRRHGFSDIVRSKGSVSIGHNVWLGDGVTVLPGVTIGNGAVVGTGAIVTNNIEPFAVTYGVPTKFVRYRFSESIRQQLEQLQWWDWSDDKISRNSAFFNTDLSTFEGNLHKLIS